MNASPRGSGPGHGLAALFVVALLVRVVAIATSGSAGAAVGLTPWEWGGEAPTLAHALFEGRGFSDPWGHGTGPSSWC